MRGEASRGEAIATSRATGGTVSRAAKELPPGTSGLTKGAGGTKVLYRPKKGDNVVSQTVKMSAPLALVYTVITDLVHYQGVYGYLHATCSS